MYAGVTSDLIKRVYEHKESLINGFTKKCKVHQLVYYETHDEILETMLREKQIKKWNRNWKLNLIEKDNPHWFDWYDGLNS